MCVCVCKDKEGDVDFLRSSLCCIFYSHSCQLTPPPAFKSSPLPFLTLLIYFVEEITLSCPPPPHSLALCSQVVFTIFLCGKALRNVEEVGVSFRSMNLMWFGWRGGWDSCSNISQSFRYLVKGCVGFRFPEVAGLWQY